MIRFNSKIPHVMVLAAVFVAGVGCGNDATEQGNPGEAKRVSAPTALVELKQTPATVSAVGNVEARERARIQSRVMAQVRDVSVEAGQHVEAGQILIQLDDRELRAAVDSARSGLEQATANAESVEKQVAVANANQAAAEANLVLANKTYARHKELYVKKAVSLQSQDEAHARAAAVAAEVTASAEGVQTVIAQRAQASAGVQQAQAALVSAETMLSYATIAAPFAGYVTRKNVKPGDQATPGVELITIENPESLRVVATVSEQDADGIQKGSVARLKLDNDVELPITEVVPSADPVTRTVEVRIDLPAGTMARPGMFVRSELVRGEEQALLIPAGALARRGQLTYVYAVDSDGIAHMTLVKPGRTAGDFVEILAGLAAGTRIVTAPTQEVQDGVRIDDGSVAQ